MHSIWCDIDGACHKIIPTMYVSGIDKNISCSTGMIFFYRPFLLRLRLGRLEVRAEPEAFPRGRVPESERHGNQLPRSTRNMPNHSKD